MAKSNAKAGFRTIKQNKLKNDSETKENKLGMVNHIHAAEYFSLASKLHYEAARYHEIGDHLNAFECTLKAMANSQLGVNCQKEDLLNHAKYD